jgi:hypothetical protein
MENEQIIWEYIDGTISLDDKILVEKKLIEDLQFKLEYDQILAIHSTFKTEDLETPSMAFDYKVLSKINLSTVRNISKINIQKLLLKIFTIFALLLLAPCVFVFKNLDIIPNKSLIDSSILTNGIVHIFTYNYYWIIAGLLLLGFTMDLIKQRNRISENVQ